MNDEELALEAEHRWRARLNLFNLPRSGEILEVLSEGVPIPYERVGLNTIEVDLKYAWSVQVRSVRRDREGGAMMEQLRIFEEESFTTRQLRECVQRELAYRRMVYPRRVAAKKMSATKADYEIAAMQAVLAHLEDE